MLIDDDLVFPIGRPDIIRRFCHLKAEEYPDHLLNFDMLQRLLSHGHKVVGGLYFGRNQNGKGMFNEASRSPEVHKQVLNPNFVQVLPTEWVATGMLLVNRDVFLAIRQKFPELAPGLKQAEDGFSYHTDYWDYFAPLTGRGEDVMFCRRAKACGFQPYVDCGCRGFHVGYNAWNFHNVNKNF
jgi:hypothetical protein